MSIHDIGQTGDVLCTYTGSPTEPIEANKKDVPIAKAILSAFLPAGFPHSVTDDYLSYQIFDSLQAFSSSIASLLANRAVLEGLGVGNAISSPTGALILTIIQDTFSRIATILFAHRIGQAIEPECKFYRFLADILNDASQFLDLLAPTPFYFPKLSIMISASILRSLCGVAANASKATLSAHFAKTGNLAELNAKEASQETIISLFGMLVGTLVINVVHDDYAWDLMTVLVAIHLWMNYRAVRSVKMRTLNRQRATMVFQEWLENNTILTPLQVSQRERVLHHGRGQLSNKDSRYNPLCHFGNYGDLHNRFPRGWFTNIFFNYWHSPFFMMNAVSCFGNNEHHIFEGPTYFVAIWQPRPVITRETFLIWEFTRMSWDPASKFHMCLALKEGISNPLWAWFDAVTHAYHLNLESVSSRSSRSKPTGWASYKDSQTFFSGLYSDEDKQTLFNALTAAGWDLETRALETSSPVRVRVGDGKKDM